MTDDVDESAGSEDLTGEILSERYRVLEELGTGSMGTVYLAEHTLMKRKVAVKVLNPDLADNEEAAERFKREAQAAANIDHPNICDATDFGRIEGDRFFLAMEHLEGRSLDEVIAEGPLEPARAVHIMTQLAAGLSRAHSMGIIHRDLKPENIFLVERHGDPDFVKITDFGVARVRLGGAEALTQAGKTYGTPLYMSPEQVAGSNIDTRSDLYSLGIILFELLTGSVPFFHKSIAVIMSKQTTEAAPRMSDVAPELDIPDDLERLVSRLLAKGAGERPQTAEEVLIALEDADLSPSDTREPEISSTAGRDEDADSEFDVPVEDVSVGDVFSSAEMDVAEKSLSRRRETPAEMIRREAFRVWGRMRALPTRHKVILGTIAAFVIVVPLFGALLFFSGGGGDAGDDAAVTESRERTLEELRRDFVEGAELGQAVAMLESGEGVKALETLEEAAKEHPRSPHLSYLLGQASAEAEKPERALSYFASAAEREPRYLEEQQLRDYVVSSMSSGDAERAKAARVVLEGGLAREFRADLARLAEHHDERKVRDRALDILEKTGEFDSLEEWQRISIRLRHTGNCQRIKRLVERAKKVGDPRALPALERNARLPETGCGFLDRSDCYECMRGSLRDAIRHLEGRQKEKK